MGALLVIGSLVVFMGAVLARLARQKPTRLHFDDKPAILTLRHPDGTTSPESLKDLVKHHCPELFAPFKPTWWLFNGHLQTIYCVAGDFSKTDVLRYKRQLIQVIEGGTIGLDFAPADASQLPEDAPIIVVLHGLTGGSYESYVRSILVPAIARGYRAVVVNFRGCAGVPITSGQMYSAGYTGDIRQALIYISNLYPRAPLFGLGFSLGANVLTRYLAEEGEQSRLLAGCALACPWHLTKNNHVLRHTAIGRVYSRAMGANLVNIIKKNYDGLSKQPKLAEPVANVLNLKNAFLDDFDETFTRIAGGSSADFPFASAHDYYEWASSHTVLPKIRKPFLAINAADDPVVQHVPFDGGGNGFVVMALTAAGGHLGWFHSSAEGKTVRWITRPVLEWLDFLSKLVVHPTQQYAKIYTDEAGFLREEGRDGGCKAVEGGGFIEASADTRPITGAFQGL
ncbi:AB hydrolase-1 domain-containing protein [Mycena chlorophos]|uniref:AB hydrolase-1 domain-containing protein n=1 Tax=Mycena chlorophos TaxID=658473 RepID=A0A8H6TUA8_MYCCL|nr:AB hydrolase-1 domain-containing protein [Mycena chlorophos]